MEELKSTYVDHPLLSEMEALFECYEKLGRRLNKVASISDRLQGSMLNRNRSLEEMAQTDSLTGLLNRRGMTKSLLAEWNRMNREATAFGLILMDIDYFKCINDTYGHVVGDHILVDTAQRLKNITRHDDACCRWGGEEFLLLLPDIDPQGIDVVYQKLRDTLKDSPVLLNDKQIEITFSAGAHIAQAGETLDACLKYTDDALYKAKRQGRNCLVWNSPAPAHR